MDFGYCSCGRRESDQGTMGFKVNGKVFILSVMMKNERREEDGFRSDR